MIYPKSLYLLLQLAVLRGLFGLMVSSAVRERNESKYEFTQHKKQHLWPFFKTPIFFFYKNNWKYKETGISTRAAVVEYLPAAGISVHICYLLIFCVHEWYWSLPMPSPWRRCSAPCPFPGGAPRAGSLSSLTPFPALPQRTRRAKDIRWHWM